MDSFPLQKFLDLVNVDRSLLVVKQAITDVQKKIQEKKREQQGIHEAHERYKSLERIARKEVDRLELSMKELEERRLFLVNRLQLVRNDKEHLALKHEIDAIKTAQHELETSLLDSWKEYEAAQAQGHQKQKESLALEVISKMTIENLAKQEHTLHDEYQALLSDRRDRADRVPQEWLDKYSFMQQKIEDPVVPVENGICTACFYSVLQQDLIDLKRRKLLACRDCFRLLYLPFSAVN
jgi:predicted  nucleic acid-binding Zn-ribbon protein